MTGHLTARAPGRKEVTFCLCALHKKQRHRMTEPFVFIGEFYMPTIRFLISDHTMRIDDKLFGGRLYQNPCISAALLSLRLSRTMFFRVSDSLDLCLLLLCVRQSSYESETRKNIMVLSRRLSTAGYRNRLIKYSKYTPGKPG
jgi:hypothetical protein